MNIFYIIDGSGYIYRAFHGLKRLSTSKGTPTNAIYGFLKMLTNFLTKRKSDFLCVVFDKGGKTFREEIFPQYKANRAAPADEILIQIKYIKDILLAYNIPVIEFENIEADDIIGTIAKKSEDSKFNVEIVSSDKDFLQLVNEKIEVFDPIKEKTYDVQAVIERFGVHPSKLKYVFAIAGDATDNIPGVKGIGEKGAVELVAKFGSIGEIYRNIDLLPQRKKELLIRDMDKAFLSLKLATINTAVPINFNLEEMKIGERDIPFLRKIFTELEFSSLLKELPSCDERMEDIEKKDFHINDEEELKNFLVSLKDVKKIAVYCEFDTTNPAKLLLNSLAIATSDDKAFFLNENLIKEKKIRVMLWKFLCDNRDKLICYNFKNLHNVIFNDGEKISSCYLDIILGAYLLNSDKTKYPVETIYLENLGEPLSIPAEVDKRSCLFAKALFQLASPMKKKLEEMQLLSLLQDVEIPLSRVLSLMEINGIKVDGEQLKKLSLELDIKLSLLEKEIYSMAGLEFNINSPKQLGEVLFEKLRLPVLKKTKTGYSTDVSVLEELSLQHDLPQKILDYRSLSKIKSTYADALPFLINPETKRIHTSFNQIATATGRLSSSDPNLQNIPVRTELGKMLREAFKAEEGWTFISADYSQIELRLLAHISEDKNLIETFRQGIDIHTQTASEIFKVKPEDVNPLMRRTAKTINFGIIYGMSAFRLGKDLKIDTHNAMDYIKKYFERYPEVKKYSENMINEARQKGFVKTILNRRRYIREINNQNKNVRAFAERTAINSPVQGSAADIIKMAMINIQKRIEEKGLNAKMLLQVHDELLFELPIEEVKELKNLVQKEMENVFALKVPLLVEIREGKKWSETHD